MRVWRVVGRVRQEFEKLPHGRGQCPDVERQPRVMGDLLEFPQEGDQPCVPVRHALHVEPYRVALCGSGEAVLREFRDIACSGQPCSAQVKGVGAAIRFQTPRRMMRCRGGSGCAPLHRGFLRCAAVLHSSSHHVRPDRSVIHPYDERAIKKSLLSVRWGDYGMSGLRIIFPKSTFSVTQITIINLLYIKKKKISQHLMI